MFCSCVVCLCVFMLVHAYGRSGNGDPQVELILRIMMKWAGENGLARVHVTQSCSCLFVFARKCFFFFFFEGEGLILVSVAVL